MEHQNITDDKIDDAGHMQMIEAENLELKRQNDELKNALENAERFNDVLFAVSKIYWIIYCLDLQMGTYERISIEDREYKKFGESGEIKSHFSKAFKENVDPEYLDEVLDFMNIDLLSERLAKRDEISHEFVSINGNWQRGHFFVNSRDSLGRAVKVFYTIQNINETKKRELEYEKKLADIAEDARRSSLSKTDFLRRMSHDIRTPINSIRGMIEIANHYSDHPDKLRDCQQKVWEASGYLLSLVNSVLDMNKLESGAVLLADNPFDLCELLDETDSLAKVQAIEHGLEYQVDFDKRRIIHRYLIGSPSHIKQIILNLAGNSVKYNKKNGSVTVWCRELSHDDDTAEFMFACTDTGIGMSKDFQKRVFEPFTQEGRENLHTRYDGSGLGLSIVKGLVEQMNGKIEFESEEGVGTSFFVTLPFKIDKGHCVAVEEVADDVDISGVKVLMAEDNDVNTEIARFFLEQMGVEVTSVTNGSEVVEAFKRSEPGYYDLILMDIMMPVLDGHEASKMIRELPRSDAATIPIIAMSANAFQDDIKQSRAIGMNDHLAKPFSSDQLVAVIGKYIRKQRLKEDI